MSPEWACHGIPAVLCHWLGAACGKQGLGVNWAVGFRAGYRETWSVLQLEVCRAHFHGHRDPV